MSEPMWILISLITGLILGIVFFGGLYWTIRIGLTAKYPGLIFSFSFLLRTGVTLAAILWVSNGKPMRILTCLMGFVVVRLLTLTASKYMKRKVTSAERM
jgi:F1F0 ATPase subunit 2